ncbi:MAG: hypothetical protein DMF61_20375 [Blastocatellia bacterium AA13]|nr:MAG: hypothetical protein DMF61_20375 [Blastocatellia bacterium AA13]
MHKNRSISLEAINMTDEHVTQLLRAVETALQEKKKDAWDKLSTLSTFLSTIMIGVIGIYFTNAYKSQEVQVAETEVAERAIPILAGQDERAKKGALLAVASLSNKALAIRLATAYSTAGTVEATEDLLKSASGGSKELLLESLLTALYSRATDEWNQVGNVDWDRMVKDISRIFELKRPEDLRQKNDGYFLADCYRMRGTAYASLGKYDESIADIKNGQAILPNYGDLYWALGWLYWQRSDLEKDQGKALKYYDRAIDLQSFGNVFLDRGRLHSEMRHADKALIDLDKYIDYAPSDSQGYYEKAIALIQKGEWVPAFHILKRASQYAMTDPYMHAKIDGKMDEVEVHLGLGDHYGNSDEAAFNAKVPSEVPMRGKLPTAIKKRSSKGYPGKKHR